MLNLFQKFHHKSISDLAFKHLGHGCWVDLPSRERAWAKLENLSPIRQFRLFGREYFEVSATTTIGEFVGIGFGASASRLGAFQSAISESFERAVFKATRNFHNLGNTNGFSSHYSSEIAENNAREEVLERDAVLTHWLTKTPFRILNLKNFESESRCNLTSDFTEITPHKLTFGITTLGFKQAIVVFLQDNSGYGVAGMAGGSSLDLAIEKATLEAVRSLHLAKELLTAAGPEPREASPYFHLHYYAGAHPLPNWTAGEPISYQDASSLMKDSVGTPLVGLGLFEYLTQAPFVVGFLKPQGVQRLYFGQTNKAIERGEINFKRLGIGPGDLNREPHFVA